jgi:hypothetical protein
VQTTAGRKTAVQKLSHAPHAWVAQGAGLYREMCPPLPGLTLGKGLQQGGIK